MSSLPSVPSKDDVAALAKNYLGGKLSQVGNLASADPSSIISSLPKSGTLFASLQAEATKTLGSVTSEVSKLKDNAMSTMSGLVGNLTGGIGDALKNSVIFTANAAKDSMSAIQLPDVTGAFDISSYTKDALSRISGFSGLDSITNNNQLTSALNSISGSFQDGLTSAQQFASDMSGDGMSFVGNALSNVTDVIPDFDYSSINKSLMDSIPDSLKNALPNSIGLGDLESQYSNLMNSLSSIPGVDAMAIEVLGLTNKIYPSYTDKDGNVLDGFFSMTDTSMSTAKQATKSAQTLCPDISSLDDILNFKDLKNLFDTLLGLAADSGLSDLLKSLLDCGTKMYNDTRSYQVLANRIDNAAARGDVSTLQVIADAAGVGKFTNPENVIYTVAANAAGTSNISKLNSLSRTLGIELPDIVKSSSQRYITTGSSSRVRTLSTTSEQSSPVMTLSNVKFTSISAAKIVGLGAGGTRIFDEDAVNVDEVTRSTALAVLQAFGKNDGYNYIGV